LTTALLSGRLLRRWVLIRRRALLAKGGRVGVRRLWLTGSVARGEGQRWSDVDLMIEADNFFDVLLLQEWWSTVLGRQVDVFYPALVARQGPEFSPNVWHDAIPLHD
jgi:predicted nucleotidyltransferase